MNSHPSLSRTRIRIAIDVCRSSFRKDGAEGESVHLLCDAAERLLDVEGRVKYLVYWATHLLRTRGLSVVAQDGPLWKLADALDRFLKVSLPDEWDVRAREETTGETSVVRP